MSAKRAETAANSALGSLFDRNYATLEVTEIVLPAGEWHAIPHSLERITQ